MVDLINGDNLSSNEYFILIKFIVALRDLMVFCYSYLWINQQLETYYYLFLPYLESHSSHFSICPCAITKSEIDSIHLDRLNFLWLIINLTCYFYFSLFSCPLEFQKHTHFYFFHLSFHDESVNFEKAKYYSFFPVLILILYFLYFLLFFDKMFYNYFYNFLNKI